MLRAICSRYALHQARNWDPAARAEWLQAPEPEPGELSPAASRSVTPEEAAHGDGGSGAAEVQQHLCGHARAQEFLRNACASPDVMVPSLALSSLLCMLQLLCGQSVCTTRVVGFSGPLVAKRFTHGRHARLSSIVTGAGRASATRTTSSPPQRWPSLPCAWASSLQACNGMSASPRMMALRRGSLHGSTTDASMRHRRVATTWWCRCRTLTVRILPHV